MFDARQIQVGTMALAKQDAPCWKAGQRAVCYEVYRSEGRPGYSFLFEHGFYDGFSPEEVATMLNITPQVIAALADYRFADVLRLEHDFRTGRFAAAFPSRSHSHPAPK